MASDEDTGKVCVNFDSFFISAIPTCPFFACQFDEDLDTKTGRK